MRYLIVIIALFFSGCSIKNYKHNQSKIIIIKSPLIKFSDLGYIRDSNNKVSLELFIAGHRIQKIDINHLICVDDGCMPKSWFNKEYLNKNYPNDLLQNILLSQPIFDKKNMLKTNDGFEQHIKNRDVSITYRVTDSITYFKDKKNKILFKIKNLVD